MCTKIFIMLINYRIILLKMITRENGSANVDRKRRRLYAV